MSFNLKKCTAAGPESSSDPHYCLASELKGRCFGRGHCVEFMLPSVHTVSSFRSLDLVGYGDEQGAANYDA